MKNLFIFSLLMLFSINCCAMDEFPRTPAKGKLNCSSLPKKGGSRKRKRGQISGVSFSEYEPELQNRKLNPYVEKLEDDKFKEDINEKLKGLGSFEIFSKEELLTPVKEISVNDQFTPDSNEIDEELLLQAPCMDNRVKYHFFRTRFKTLNAVELRTIIKNNKDDETVSKKIDFQ